MNQQFTVCSDFRWRHNTFGLLLVFTRRPTCADLEDAPEHKQPILETIEFH